MAAAQTAQVLPRQLRLQAPATMPQARSYLFNVTSQGQNNKYSGETITINIPRLQRSYLTKDSYLRFKFQTTFTATALAAGDAVDGRVGLEALPCWDVPGVFGLINRIEVYDYLGSTLLESTGKVAELATTLLDIGCNNSTFGNYYNLTAGTLGSSSVFGGVYKGGSLLAASNSYTDATYDVVEPGSGTTTGGTATTDFTAAVADAGNAVVKTWQREYAIPLLSFLGSLSDKFVPLHNGFTIQITLNTFGKAIGFARAGRTVANVVNVGTGSPAGGINENLTYLYDVGLNCQVLELGPVAESMVLSSTGGNPLVVPTKAWRNFNSVVVGGQSNHKLDLNLNVASLTNLLFIQRPTTLNTNIYEKRYLSHRIRNYLVSWFFQYGSSVLPQTQGISARGRLGLTNDQNKRASTEAYFELLKSRHRMNQDQQHGIINLSGYNVDGTVNANDYLTLANLQRRVIAAGQTVPLNRGTFAAGLDLELVAGRSNDLICGMNTNGMNTSINLTFDTANAATDGGAVVDAMLDCWCEYDAFINLAPGLATTVSF